MKFQPLLLSALCLLSACSDNSPEVVNDKAVARASSAYVTQGDIDHHLQRFDPAARMAIIDDKQQYHRLVESIALTRVMAQKQQASMTPEQRHDFDLAIQAYRDQMLAKSYIEKNVQRQVPDRKAVEEYYQAHASEFGQRKQYTVTEIQVPDSCALSKPLLEPVLNKARISELQKMGCKLSSSERKVTAEQVAEYYPALKETLVADYAYWSNVAGIPLLLSVTAVTELPARPLSEVTAEIRRRLAPEYLKQSLEKERTQLNKEIEFLD